MLHPDTSTRPLQRTEIAILLALGLVLLAYRFWVIVTMESPLFYDEIYYYGWALTPDWGYYSKPPVVAWVIALTTSLFGDSPLGIKMGAGLLYSGACALIYLSCCRLTGSRSAFFASLAFLTLPLISFNSLFITTDAPLLFFWALALYGFIRAYETNAWRWWLLAALAGGLGLLSKYTFILFPAAFLGFALISATGRKLLGNPRFWIACMLALSCLLPNLYWNYQHDFISFQHTAQISKQTENTLSFSRLLEFWGQQLIVFSPLFFMVLLLSPLRRKVPSQDSSKLLWWLFVPTFLAISAQAFMARANMNWAAPAYVSAVMLTGYYLQYWTRFWLMLALVMNLLLMGALYHYGAVANMLGVELKRASDPYSRVKGWPEFVHSLQPVFDQYPDHQLASNSRSLLSYFGYYLQPKQMNSSYLDATDFIDDHYELMYPVKTGDKYLFVTADWHQQQLERYFSTVEKVGQQHIKLYPKLSRSASVYRVSGFKGKELSE